MSDVPPGARELNTGRPLDVQQLQRYANALPAKALPKKRKRKRRRRS